MPTLAFLFNGERVRLPRLVDFILCSTDGTTSFRVPMGAAQHVLAGGQEYVSSVDGFRTARCDPRNVKVLSGTTSLAHTFNLK